MIMKRQRHTSEIRGQRIRVTSKVLTYIKLVKMYTWEKPFAKIIKGAVKLAFCPQPVGIVVGHALTLWGFPLCSVFVNICVANFGAFLIYLSDLRSKERKLIEKTGFIQSLNTMLLFITPTVVMVVMFLAHIGLKLELTTSKVSVRGFSFSSHIDRKSSHVSFPSSWPSKILMVLQVDNTN